MNMDSTFRRRVATWLFLCAAMVFAMVVLGGAVRLTGSGLSMVDWQPLVGALPPLNEAAWEQVFARYREYPEYRLVNKGMSLDEFQFIFYMEYFHRLLGRLVGLVFALPFFYWLVRGVLPGWLKPRLWFALLLGGAQGLLGWYMVKSGLVDNPHVSQYRLTAHLMLAVFIYAWLLALAFRLSSPAAPAPLFRILLDRWRRRADAVLALVFVMIATGGFMAGTRAGYIYNTWPWMGEDWMPESAWALTPLWRNLTENPVGVQFVHRWLAIAVMLAVVAFAIGVIRRVPHSAAKLLGAMALAMVMLQVALGIATLVSGVPVMLGVAHQGGALVLLAILLALRARLCRGGDE